MKSTLSTLCYIESDGMRLSMQKYAKPGLCGDQGPYEWNGVYTCMGPDESPDQAMLRGLDDFWGTRPESYAIHAMITIIRENQPDEYLFVFTAEYPGASSVSDPASGAGSAAGDGCGMEGWVWIQRDWFYEPLMAFNDRGLPQIMSDRFPFFSMKFWIKDGRLLHWHLAGDGDPFPGWDGSLPPPDHEAKALGIPAAPACESAKIAFDSTCTAAAEDAPAVGGNSEMHVHGPCAGISSTILQCAFSYYQNTDKLIYSGGRRTFLSGWPVHDKERNMRGNIDCSTYILLVCSGIPYEESPYARQQDRNFYRNMEDLKASDADAVRRGTIKSGTIRSASDIVRYYYQRGCCFTDPSCAQAGDLVFFRAKPLKVPYQKHFGGFLSISHVGILADQEHYLEATGSQIKPSNPGLIKDPVRLTPLSSRQDIVCFARPNQILRIKY